MMFKRGSLVWAKLPSYPWWPAIVISHEDCGRDKTDIDKVWLFWFGDKKISQVRMENILDFETNFKNKTILINGKMMQRAVKEILTVSAQRHNISLTDKSDLFGWANNEIKEFTVSKKVYDGNNGLPNVVLKTLKEKYLKRKIIEESESESEDEEISEVISRVHKGIQKLEEICIICCKLQAFIIKEHPFFTGGICQNCQAHIKYLNAFEFGKLQDFCVVCCQGGNLVYCCNDLCLSSYCDLCIDYMVGLGSFKKITKNEYWKCFLCEPSLNKKCLIQRRHNFESKVIYAPSFPEDKRPIRVIALNNSACQFLENEIEVEMYCIKPSNAVSSRRVIDFNKEQFSKIKADLIYGSYFISTTVPIDAKKEMLSFSAEFFKFLYRLDNAKFFNSVFFIFMSDIDFNCQMLSRVLRFLEVEPITFKTGLKNILVWTNIPNLSHQKSKILQLKIKENYTPEEEILSRFVEPLKKYFKNIT